MILASPVRLLGQDVPNWLSYSDEMYEVVPGEQTDIYEFEDGLIKVNYEYDFGKYFFEVSKLDKKSLKSISSNFYHDMEDIGGVVKLLNIDDRLYLFYLAKKTKNELYLNFREIDVASGSFIAPGKQLIDSPYTFDHPIAGAKGITQSALRIGNEHSLFNILPSIDSTKIAIVTRYENKGNNLKDPDFLAVHHFDAELNLQARDVFSSEKEDEKLAFVDFLYKNDGQLLIVDAVHVRSKKGLTSRWWTSYEILDWSVGTKEMKTHPIPVDDKFKGQFKLLEREGGGYFGVGFYRGEEQHVNWRINVLSAKGLFLIKFDNQFNAEETFYHDFPLKFIKQHQGINHSLKTQLHGPILRDVWLEEDQIFMIAEETKYTGGSVHALMSIVVSKIDTSGANVQNSKIERGNVGGFRLRQYDLVKSEDHLHLYFFNKPMFTKADDRHVYCKVNKANGEVKRSGLPIKAILKEYKGKTMYQTNSLAGDGSQLYYIERKEKSGGQKVFEVMFRFDFQ